MDRTVSRVGVRTGVIAIASAALALAGCVPLPPGPLEPAVLQSATVTQTYVPSGQVDGPLTITYAETLDELSYELQHYQQWSPPADNGACGTFVTTTVTWVTADGETGELIDEEVCPGPHGDLGQYVQELFEVE